MLQIILIALSLSLDAFCLSVTNGLVVRSFGLRHALLMGAYFGGFQFLMPLLGSFLAGTVSSYIGHFGPYISFLLLAFIGVKMIIEARKSDGEEGSSDGGLTHRKLIVMAVATSIDALAVGITFAFMEIPLIASCIIIGVITFAVCVPAGMFGRKIPVKSGKTAEIIGGCVLVGIGIKILAEGVIG